MQKMATFVNYAGGQVSKGNMKYPYGCTARDCDNNKKGWCTLKDKICDGHTQNCFEWEMT